MFKFIESALSFGWRRNKSNDSSTKSNENSTSNIEDDDNTEKIPVKSVTFSEECISHDYDSTTDEDEHELVIDEGSLDISSIEDNIPKNVNKKRRKTKLKFTGGKSKSPNDREKINAKQRIYQARYREKLKKRKHELSMSQSIESPETCKTVDNSISESLDVSQNNNTTADIVLTTRSKTAQNLTKNKTLSKSAENLNEQEVEIEPFTPKLSKRLQEKRLKQFEQSIKLQQDMTTNSLETEQIKSEDLSSSKQAEELKRKRIREYKKQYYNSLSHEQRIVLNEKRKLYRAKKRLIKLIQNKNSIESIPTDSTICETPKTIETEAKMNFLTKNSKQNVSKQMENNKQEVLIDSKIQFNGKQIQKLMQNKSPEQSNEEWSLLKKAYDESKWDFLVDDRLYEQFSFCNEGKSIYYVTK